MSLAGKRRLKITGCKLVRSGESKGTPWYTYEVSAQTPEGEPVPHRLYAWVPVAVMDDLQSFDVYESRHSGFSEYWLRFPRRAAVDPLAAVQARLTALEERLARLEAA